MMYYWGFDLGDGESTLARVAGEGSSVPEIIEVDGKKVTITVWAVMRSGEVRIGENAARSASSAVRSAARFKRRFLDAQSDSAALIRDFSARVFESLRGSGALTGGEKSNSVYVGCPAGWDAGARARYQRIFETIGFPTPHVVSESRAVMVGAIQSNSVRDYRFCLYQQGERGRNPHGRRGRPRRRRHGRGASGRLHRRLPRRSKAPPRDGGKRELAR